MRKLRFIEEHEENEYKKRMQEQVLASHLAMVNVYLALEADKDLVPKSNQKAPTDAKIEEHNQSLIHTKERVRSMVLSAKAYIRATGYHGIFDMEPETLKTAEEMKAEQIERNRQLSEESRAFFLKDSVLARAAKKGATFGA